VKYAVRYDRGAEYEKLELVVTYKEIKTIYGNRSVFFILFILGNRNDCLGSGKNESGRVKSI
jgi:hypothetical protein